MGTEKTRLEELLKEIKDRKIKPVFEELERGLFGNRDAACYVWRIPFECFIDGKKELGFCSSFLLSYEDQLMHEKGVGTFRDVVDEKLSEITRAMIAHLEYILEKNYAC